jgi:hypothetical protein
MNTAGWAQVGSAVFTAGAAGSALAAVRQSQREWRASREPSVSVDVVSYFPSGTMQLHVANLGGIVLKAMTVVIEGRQVCMGFLPPTAFLRPGEIRTYNLELDAVDTDEATAVIYGFDARRRFVYAWSANSQSHRWPAKRGRLKSSDTRSAVDILHQFYPDAPDPFDLELRANMTLTSQ